MIDVDELTRRIAGVERREIMRWIENRWVLPDEQGGRWVFHEVDVARVELIRQMRHEFSVDEETMPLVLGLLDQVYGLRRQLRRLCDALESQPPEVREAVRRALPPANR